MRDVFLATRELNICVKIQVCSSKTVAASLRTNKYTYIQTDRQRIETGETRGKTSTSRSSVPVSIKYWFAK